MAGLPKPYSYSQLYRVATYTPVVSRHVPMEPHWHSRPPGDTCLRYAAITCVEMPLRPRVPHRYDQITVWLADGKSTMIKLSKGTWELVICTLQPLLGLWLEVEVYIHVRDPCYSVCIHTQVLGIVDTILSVRFTHQYVMRFYDFRAHVLHMRMLYMDI